MGGERARPDLCVIVPTRNRARILSELLASLVQQRTEGCFTFEIVVVDNGSTDGTSRLVQKMAADCPVPMTCLVEPRPGKPFAANTGIAHARSDVLAFTDDDVVAEPAWLLGIWRCFRETDAEAVAGRILPLWVDGRPEWMTDHIMGKLGTLGCADFGTERLVINPATRQYWWVGGNIAVRRELMERLGGFDVRRLRGEDAELFDRYRRSGVRVVYEPAAVVHHKIGKERLTPAYFRAWHETAGRYRTYSIPWRPHHLLIFMPVYCYRELFRWSYLYWKTGWSSHNVWERLGYECRVRGWLSVLRQRMIWWPRWCLTLLTGRSYLP